jgi:two-component system sensor histidine kinase YesM
MIKGFGTNKRKWEYFGFRSIRSKLLISYFIAIAVPILTLGIYSLKLLDQSIKEHSIAAEKENLIQLAENAKYYLNSCIDLSNNVYFDNKIWDYFYYKYSYPTISIEGYYSLIRPVFARYLALKKEVSKITVFTKNETLLFNNFEIAQVLPDTYEENLYEKTLSANKILWNIVQNPGEQKRIIMSRMLNLNNVNVGMLVIYINEDHLHNVIKDNTDGSSTYLTAPDGTVLTSTDRSAVGSNIIDSITAGSNILQYNSETKTEGDGIYIQEIDTEDGVIRVASLSFVLQDHPDEYWNIIKIVPMKSVLSVASPTKTYQIIGFLLLLVLLGLISIVISQSLSKRIKTLMSKMKQVENGDFNVSVEFNGRDEISYMGRAFNTMVKKLDRLVKQVYKMQLTQKELELKNREIQLNMLQSQINPHFLFNTLDAVLYGIRHDKQETEKIVELLASNLRRSIQWEKDLITVNEEIKFIEEYLSIQKFRMQDKLEWCLEISPEALSYKMPKMLIQPLVENAIYHGISMKKEKGKLCLSVYIDQEFLVVVVDDNGVGMKAPVLNEIRQMLGSNDINARDSHIGIKNVFDRIQLYYGNKGSFEIKSEYLAGTRIELKLPLYTEGGVDCV